MKLAVVIPSYNHAHYIGAALDSVLGQTRKPQRIIVVDDGSKDDSLSLLRTFEARGVEVHAQENKGAHATINRLIDLASQDCDAISILNSDDFYTPTRFEKLLPALEKETAKAVVVSDLQYIDENSSPLPADHPRGKWKRAVWASWSQPDLDLAAWMGQANFAVTTSNVIARLDFLRAHPFKPYRFNHDYYFLAQAALRDQLAVVGGEPLVSYRVHSTNTINTSPAPLIRELLRQHLDLYHDLAPELATDPALRARFSRYMRAAWENVSAFDAGLFQTLVAQFVELQSPETIESLIAGLSDEASWPELAAYPNKSLVNNSNGTTPLSCTPGALAEKYDTQRASLAALKATTGELRELARLRQRLLQSRWAALGQLVGAARQLSTDEGKTPTEKLAALQERVATNRWLRFGQSLGLWKSES